MGSTESWVEARLDFAIAMGVSVLSRAGWEEEEERKMGGGYLQTFSGECR